MSNEDSFSDENATQTSVTSQTGHATGEILKMMDRGMPDWTRFVSYFFAVGAALCVLSIPVLTIYFQTLVIEERNTAYSPALTLIGCVPIIGYFVFEYAHAKSLAGFRKAREINVKLAFAGVGSVIFILLSYVHLAIGLAIPLTCVAGASFLYWYERFPKREPLWDFNKGEAISILSGRDSVGLSFANETATSNALNQVVVISGAILCFVLTLGISSWLTSFDILNQNAVVAVAISALISSFWILNFASDFLQRRENPSLEARQVLQDPAAHAQTDPLELQGLCVDGLTVKSTDGRTLLSDVSFTIAPGSIVGVIGDSNSGKTLLQKAIVDPFGLTGLTVSGRVSYNGLNLWQRSLKQQNIPAVFVEANPKMLASSGLNNLTCFDPGNLEMRGKRILEQLVFSADAVDEICETKDASFLPTSASKALSLARAFLLSPALYLIDRPEDGASEKLLGAVVSRLQNESSAGRSFVIVSENRSILELCNNFLVLQQGRIVDYGPADEIRRRMSSGWARFVSVRQLDAEENLESWVRSHFKRDGDEANRRKVCSIFAELLAFTCQTTDAVQADTVSFEFKHFEGYCLVKLRDRETMVSSGILERARQEATNNSQRKSPLAKVFMDCSEFDQTIEHDQRVISVKIETYDPRKPKDANKRTNAIARV